MQAKKKALPKRLLESAWEFAKTANEFNKLAAKVKGGNRVAVFQESAKLFMEAGLKFREVGDLVYELALNGNCTHLAAKAQKFQQAATAFNTEASNITAESIQITENTITGKVKESITVFKNAMVKFYGAAASLETFSDALTSSTCKSDIVAMAKRFQEKAVEFSLDANMFHIKAQRIQEGSKLTQDNIHTKFPEAAKKFGNTDGKPGEHGAAWKLYKAIETLVT